MIWNFNTQLDHTREESYERKELFFGMVNSEMFLVPAFRKLFNRLGTFPDNIRRGSNKPQSSLLPTFISCLELCFGHVCTAVEPARFLQTWLRDQTTVYVMPTPPALSLFQSPFLSASSLSFHLCPSSSRHRLFGKILAAGFVALKGNG